MTLDAKALYKSLKGRPPIYEEELHCPMVLEVFGNSYEGTVAHFCVKAGITERTFYAWASTHKLFGECYGLAKMYARVTWEDDGKEIVHVPLNELGCRFEHWRMIGWARFGVGKNSRIRLNLSSSDNPSDQYKQILEQASQGDFTAGEIKQLMEAVNVGLNAYQVFELQKEIDILKSDLEKMSTNKDGQNTYTNTGTAEEDTHTVADNLCE